MTRKIRSYESDELIVDYDIKRCIHAEECVHGLPGVFDPARRPWIDPSNADPGEIVPVIERCPTGALHYRWRKDGPEEKPPAANTVRVSADGPLYLRGRLRIKLPDGNTLHETRVALCRCGQSKDKPFCDNTHRETGFSDDATLADIRLKPVEEAPAQLESAAAQLEGAPEELEISFAKNGPTLFRGPVRILNDRGASKEGGGGAFCRCGNSSTKPFCDGTHKTVGFSAD